MKLDGFVPFPEEYVEKYREKGYWEDRTIADVLRQTCLDNADSVALCDADTTTTFGELDRTAENLALNLLDAGLEAGDIVVLQLANTFEFVYTYLALQKAAVRPILALHTHRFRELRQFVELSGARATITLDRTKDCDFGEVINRIQSEQETLKLKFMLGEVADGFVDLRSLIDTQSESDPVVLENIQQAIDPCEPALFLLSGGTTGIPKLIPRTHNDYVCNSKLAAKCTAIDDASVLLDVLPIAHNLPLACPGLQGFMLRGAKTVLHTSTRAQDVFPLIEKYRVTHIHVVPALLIKWMNDPLVSEFDLSSIRVIQSGGQRLQPETRLLTERLLPSCTVQENFGMAEGMLMFVRLDDPREVRLETVGRPVCEDDEVLILDEEDNPVADGETGEFCCRGPYTLRGYFNAAEHNARAFTKEGFYRSGDLMRRHPSGNYVVEGRNKDVINRGGEKISAEETENLILGHSSVMNVACVPMVDEVLGERMCACAVLKPGATLTLQELKQYLVAQEIAKYKLPERLELFDTFPLSTFGKVSKKDLGVAVAERIAVEESGA